MAELEDALAKELCDIVREAVAAAIKPLRDKIATLEARIVEAETQAAQFKYVGVWRAGDRYRKNNFITFDGSLWVCQRDDSEGRPGQSLDWQLAVRKGNNGKDGKDAKVAA